MDVRRRLGDILNRVALRQDQFIIERNGKPMAAVVPVAKLEQLDRTAREYLLQVFRKQRDRLSQEEADRVADESKHASRRPKRRHK
jgi:prevent-host-death family protein